MAVGIAVEEVAEFGKRGDALRVMRKGLVHAIGAHRMVEILYPAHRGHRGEERIGRAMHEGSALREMRDVFLVNDHLVSRGVANGGNVAAAGGHDIHPFGVSSIIGGLDLHQDAELVRRLHIFLHRHPGMETDKVKAERLDGADHAAVIALIARRMRGQRIITVLADAANVEDISVQAEVLAIGREAAHAELAAKRLPFNGKGNRIALRIGKRPERKPVGGQGEGFFPCGDLARANDLFPVLDLYAAGGFQRGGDAHGQRAQVGGGPHPRVTQRARIQAKLYVAVHATRAFVGGAGGTPRHGAPHIAREAHIGDGKHHGVLPFDKHALRNGKEKGSGIALVRPDVLAVYPGRDAILRATDKETRLLYSVKRGNGNAASIKKAALRIGQAHIRHVTAHRVALERIGGVKAHVTPPRGHTEIVNFVFPIGGNGIGDHVTLKIGQFFALVGRLGVILHFPVAVERQSQEFFLHSGFPFAFYSPLSYYIFADLSTKIV